MGTEKRGCNEPTSKSLDFWSNFWGSVHFYSLFFNDEIFYSNEIAVPGFTRLIKV